MLKNEWLEIRIIERRQFLIEEVKEGTIEKLKEE